MLGDIRRLLGAMRALEKGDQIVVEGVPSKLMVGDIKRVWGTSKLATHMFTKVTRNSLMFYKFYAVEVLYTVERLLDEHRKMSSPRALARLRDVLLTQTWLASTIEDQPSEFNWNALRNFYKTPLDTQMEFLKQYERNKARFNLKGYYLAAPPGAGKTLTGLMLSELLEADTVIVVSPPNAVHRVWKQTIESEIKRNYSTWNSMDQGPVPNGCKHFIFHYHALEKAIPLLKSKRFNKPMVIIDEGHNFNEIDSQRTFRLIQLCMTFNVPDVLWASGTPLKAVGYEAIPFLRTIDPFFTEQVEAGFRKLFGKQASKALDVLANRLGLVMHRVDKKTVVDNDVTEEVVQVTMPNAQDFTLESIRDEMIRFISERIQYYERNMRHYKAIYGEAMEIHKSKLRTEREKEEFLKYGQYIVTIRKGYQPAEHKDLAKFCNQYELRVISPNLPDKLRAEFRNARSVIKYVDLKIRGEALGRILGKRRSQCHMQMVRHSKLPELVEGSLKKTLVFSSYVDVVEETERYLTEEGFKPLVVYGKTNKDLKQIIEQFDKDIDYNPLVATYDSLSTAVPLVMANTVILLNEPFRAHEREQTTSRVDRLGQDSPVFIYTTLLDTGQEPNISTRSRDIMEWSKEQVDKMLGTTGSSDLSDIPSIEMFLEELPDEVSLESRVLLGDLPPSAAF